MFLFALFLPGKCFTKRKAEIFYRVLVIGIIVVVTLIAYYVYIHRADGGIPFLVREGVEVNTFAHLFADPIMFAKMCKRTIVGYFEYYLNSMIGAELGWIEISINKIAIEGFLALSIIGAFKTFAAEKSLVLRDRIVFPVIFMISALGLAVIMFVSWTAIGSWDIMGLQGRYFLPVWPLFLLFAARWPKPVRPAWLSDKTLIFVACALHVFVLVSAYLFIAGRDA